jgi:alpha-L-fucosidase
VSASATAHGATGHTCRGPRSARQMAMLFRASLLALAAAAPPALAAAPPGPPLPNARQADFLRQELTQFFHFGIPTFWDPPSSYLYGPNPTYHDCSTTAIDHGNQTGLYYPCLDPIIFNPTDFSADDWMQHATALGTSEICLTAHHEGGFALWPTNFSKYSVKLAANWRGGKGDVLREFADAANRWGVKICYYLNVADDGYETLVAKATPEQFIRTQVGMMKEVLANYGPVSRMWFDGTTGGPKGLNFTQLWAEVYDTIRTASPATLISPYRGDICATTGSLYTSDGPEPNSTDGSACAKPSETGAHFYPSEMHGITAQMGPDGNTDSIPTYWFWHPWAWWVGGVGGGWALLLPSHLTP